MRERTTAFYRRARFWLGLAGLLGVWAATAPLLADLLVSDRPIEHADAIVILSGAADYVQRTEGGAAAYRNGISEKILLTNDDQRGGWDDAEKGNPYFIERAERELIKRGVPAEAIERLPEKVNGTDDEAHLLVRLSAERGYKNVAIVTSDYHSKRALWIFDQRIARNQSDLNLGLVRSPAGPRYPGRNTWWMSLRGWRSVGAEYLKIGYYWLFYSL